VSGEICPDGLSKKGSVVSHSNSLPVFVEGPELLVEIGGTYKSSPPFLTDSIWDVALLQFRDDSPLFSTDQRFSVRAIAAIERHHTEFEWIGDHVPVQGC
jgi:hypothetical protein